MPPIETKDSTKASFGFTDIDSREKPAKVAEIFSRVAARYDVMNDVMSLGVHHLWKDAACARLNPQPGEVILDCAGGTGDIARRLVKLARNASARRGLTTGATVHLVDYNAEMVEAGRERGLDPDIDFSVGDATHLAVADARFDAYIISFGIRNVVDIDAALAEARRVLKPGGRFICLEFSHPQSRVIQSVYDNYSFHIIPQMGQWVSKDRASYQYLVESIRRFPDQEAFKAMMVQAGFKRVTYTNFSGGVCALHQAWV